ncbi:hypothetical protein CEXT_86641 [Caerostris extrusa]|uniref:Uncharacterized protein n=1 Tax=Caerostris extrusa TaxID=172846 RepID=A0AAV4N698_CAEEX|nr:hypothetical protein CEXT_86641 [Caerostris extrusa]
MDETRCVSLVFLLVGLGLLAQYLYFHIIWSFIHLLFYIELMTITVKENGGLKALVSALDRWAAEIVTRRNDELGIDSSFHSACCPCGIGWMDIAASEGNTSTGLQMCCPFLSDTIPSVWSVGFRAQHQKKRSQQNSRCMKIENRNQTLKPFKEEDDSSRSHAIVSRCLPAFGKSLLTASTLGHKNDRYEEEATLSRMGHIL